MLESLLWVLEKVSTNIEFIWECIVESEKQHLCSVWTLLLLSILGTLFLGLASSRHLLNKRLGKDQSAIVDWAYGLAPEIRSEFLRVRLRFMSIFFVLAVFNLCIGSHGYSGGLLAFCLTAFGYLSASGTVVEFAFFNADTSDLPKDSVERVAEYANVQLDKHNQKLTLNLSKLIRKHPTGQMFLQNLAEEFDVRLPKMSSEEERQVASREIADRLTLSLDGAAPFVRYEFLRDKLKLKDEQVARL